MCLTAQQFDGPDVVKNGFALFFRKTFFFKVRVKMNLPLTTVTEHWMVLDSSFCFRLDSELNKPQGKTVLICEI